MSFGMLAQDELSTHTVETRAVELGFKKPRFFRFF